jgi:linoleate 10R-lipoxygenase
MRHLPSHYTFNSTVCPLFLSLISDIANFSHFSQYALFPFTTPYTTGEILKNLKIAERYDASRPTPTLPWATVHSRKAVEEVLNDENSFTNIYGPHIAALQDKYSQPPILSHFKAFDTPAKRAGCLSLVDSVMFPQHWAQKLFVSVGEATKQQISESAWSTSTGPNGMLRLDVVSDLVVPVAMNHLAKVLGLPMKTK